MNIIQVNIPSVPWIRHGVIDLLVVQESRELLPVNRGNSAGGLLGRGIPKGKQLSNEKNLVVYGI